MTKGMRNLNRRATASRSVKNDMTSHPRIPPSNATPRDRIRIDTSNRAAQSGHHAIRSRGHIGESTRINNQSRSMLVKKYGMSDNTNVVETPNNSGDDPSRRHATAAHPRSA